VYIPGQQAELACDQVQAPGWELLPRWAPGCALEWLIWAPRAALAS